MFEPHAITFEGKRYLLVRYLCAADHRGRQLDHLEGVWLLERMLQDLTTRFALRDIYQELWGGPFSHASDYDVLRRFERELDSFSGLGDSILIECDELLEAPKVVEDSSPEGHEVRRIEALLSALGKDELAHRGRNYRLLRAADNAYAPERKRFEAVNEQEAVALVRELAADPQRPQKQREALSALLATFEARPKRPHQELLLLRRLRVYVVPENEGPAITPSALRKLREPHWIEVEFVDADKQPVPGLQVLLIHDDGSEKPIRSDDQGRVRWEPVAPGNVSIRLPDLDADMWKALGGPAAQTVHKTNGYTKYIVKRGDNLSRIARAHGLKGWKKLWEDPKNEPLRKKRKDPNILRPGDEVMVPGKTVQEALRAVDGVYKVEVERLRVRTAFVLDTDDTRFHPGSCVFLGECSDLTDPQTLSGSSGMDALAAGLLHARDNPTRKLLIIGHSDAAGSDEKNQTLSEVRAKALKHLLLGERDPWVELVKKHSTIADYQQICAWISVVRGWPCTPFEVSGKKDPDNARIIKAFQVAYNEHFGTSIAEDGAIGPQTWGAVFDVYEQQLEYRLETDRAGLGALRSAIQFCGVAETYGGGSALALRAGAKIASGEQAAQYRRADILFFEAGDEPSALHLEEGPPAAPEFALTPIPVAKGPTLVWLSLQTVDELGYALGNVELVFRSEAGETHQTTDSHGLWRGQVNAQGNLEVSVADGRALGLGSSATFSQSVPLSLRWATRAITDLVVQGAVDPKLLAEHKAYVARYDAAPDSALQTLRNGLIEGPLPGREPMEQASLFAEEMIATRRAIRARAADNLFMAADMDASKLVDVINVMLEDRCPDVTRRKYLLEIYVHDKVFIFDSEGQTQRVFNFKPLVHVRSGRTGLHTLVTTGRERNPDGALFVDAAENRTLIDVGLWGIKNEQAESSNADGEPRALDIVRTAEVIADRERNDYLQILWDADARGLTRVAYVWRSDSWLIAAVGGTGKLESYPSSEAIRQHVHTRNKAVVRSMYKAYGAQMDDFIEAVRAIHPDPEVAKAQGKMHPELQLYALLPPLPTPALPTPPGITDGELWDLTAIDSGTSEYAAWKAIAQKHNEIWKVRTAGSLWLVTEFSASAGFDENVGGGGKLEVKLNFEVSTDPMTDSIEVSQTNEFSVFLKNLQYNTETGVTTGTLKDEKLLGPFELEADSTGKLSLSYGLAKSSHDPATRQVSAALSGSISLGGLVERGMKLKGKDWGELGKPEWLKALPTVSAEVSLNVQLSRPSDIMAVITRSPGLTALGPRLVFMHADWGSLHPYQRAALEVLGWDEELWDTKDLPDSARKPYDALTPNEKRAALHLPVPREGHWQDFWAGFAKPPR